MSWADYQRVAHTFPVVLDLPAGTGRLIYIGSHHTHDPAHSDIALIERLWNESQPSMAFNEGGDPPVLPDREATIRAYGEAGFVRWLARQAGIPVKSIDPSRSESVASLSNRFTAQQLKLFFALLQVKDHREHPTEPFAERMARVFTVLNATPGLAVPPFNVTELERDYKTLFPSAGAFTEVPSRWFDPVGQDNFLNQIARISSELRDGKMVETLIDATCKGQHVFAVVGGTHVVMQERAIRAAIARCGRQKARGWVTANPPAHLAWHHAGCPSRRAVRKIARRDACATQGTLHHGERFLNVTPPKLCFGINSDGSARGVSWLATSFAG